MRAEERAKNRAKKKAHDRWLAEERAKNRAKKKEHDRWLAEERAKNRAKKRAEMMEKYNDAKEQYLREKAKKLPQPPAIPIPPPARDVKIVMGGGGVGFDLDLDPVITTKAGVKAQRFQGVLFEANHSSLTSGSISCEIDKKTGEKVCSGGCFSETYRRIDEKTGKVIYHISKPLGAPMLVKPNFLKLKRGTGSVR